MERERYQRTPSETEMQRSGRETYETAGGYGQQTSETGIEQPSIKERMESTFTGRSAEEQARHDRAREYASETGAAAGAGTGSLGDSMRSTFSSRPALQSAERPTVGEQVKGMFTGRGAEEQRAYDIARERERERGTGTGRGYEQGRERGYGTGTGTTSGTEQPSLMERVEATFTRRTPQEQHEHDARQRYEREHEQRARGSSSEPGLMSTMGGALSSMTGAVFGSTEHTPKRTLKQRMQESIHEIRTNLTGRTGETSYTPMERSTYHTGSEYSTGRTGRGTGTVY